MSRPPPGPLVWTPCGWKPPEPVCSCLWNIPLTISATFIPGDASSLWAHSPPRNQLHAARHRNSSRPPRVPRYPGAERIVHDEDALQESDWAGAPRRRGRQKGAEGGGGAREWGTCAPVKVPFGPFVASSNGHAGGGKAIVLQSTL